MWTLHLSQVEHSHISSFLTLLLLFTEIEDNSDKDGQKAGKSKLEQNLKIQDKFKKNTFTESEGGGQAGNLAGQSTASTEQSESSDEDIGPPLPPGFKPLSTAKHKENSPSLQQLKSSDSKSQSSDSEDDSDIGPPLPPGFVPFGDSRSQKTDEQKSSKITPEDHISSNAEITGSEHFGANEDQDDVDPEDEDTAEDEDDVSNLAIYTTLNKFISVTYTILQRY